MRAGRRRLDGVVFDCGCNIRWIQLWQERGEAGLHTQQLYCRSGASKMKLHHMYIQNCGEYTRRLALWSLGVNAKTALFFDVYGNKSKRFTDVKVDPSAI